ncbi:polynucleotide kinase 3'-phosphatase, variant 1 [Aphanomyces astaci]|uniref:Polynucleotide kinase 3'-phosphatase, variant 1 n=1 Tax=Aphanomyces astaci TaxID=112090 RepID=W4GE96_APHAT|nr:polynucleotide kinase 3'-phosphatase, variant 1 [Aphanomyces astaci]ETV78007.1 polynucleotide kinase 3'-phosphatase, variant 1 [Aphanomyces astaci]|eukprot:XP_009832346.1 polynucleotide kinase 3'-phosphatase, variant 1 [Aphanomyces astaci]
MDKFITKSTKRAASAGDDGDNASHTSTNKKVKSESISAPAVGDCTWETIGTVLYMHNIPRSTGAPIADNTLASIAAFDMDSTLISTKSGKTFPTNANDWKFWNECVPAKLRALVADGYHVVIFSNQSGLSKGRVGATELKTKIQAIAAQLNLPLRVFLMSADDHMRKPRTGAWKLLLDHCSLNVDAATSFYCGDAAGRPKAPGKPKKDFSCADYKFALNVGVPFHTPERLFLQSTLSLHCKESSFDLGFDPRTLLHPVTTLIVTPHDAQEMVVLVGSPASGKSSFCKAYFPGYARINQDTLKTAAKCKAAAQDLLSSGRSIVVDNTNRDVKTRAEWVALARTNNVPVRAFYLDVTKPVVFHLNEFRMLLKERHPDDPDLAKPNVPDMVIHGFFKNVQVPTVRLLLLVLLVHLLLPLPT